MNCFFGKISDVEESQQEYCKSARSATEGFIAVAKNIRGFSKSLYRGITGDKIWASLCQGSYNLRKFILLYEEEKIEEEVLIRLGLLSG